jgi:predicted DCC family thiol-disulfide oxidoreductase YuxK
MTRGAPVRVLYDGDCGLCQRSARILKMLDVLGQLAWVDFRSTPVDVDLLRLEQEMAAISNGRTYFGFSAYRTIAWRIPIMWPALPVLYFPGVKLVGDAVYAWIARRRRHICPLPRPH